MKNKFHTRFRKCSPQQLRKAQQQGLIDHIEGFIFIKGDDNDTEVLCKHGVGHGYNVHTCDGTACCRKALSNLRKGLRKNGKNK